MKSKTDSSIKNKIEMSKITHSVLPVNYEDMPLFLCRVIHAELVRRLQNWSLVWL